MEKVFVTGGTGYIGKSLIQEAFKENMEIIVLTRSDEKARQLVEQGVSAVVGDLLEDGEWQKVIQECQYVIHLAAPPTWGKKVTKKVALEYSHGHYAMTVRLLNHINPSAIQNIIYVAGTSYLGDSGSDMPKDETYRSEPKGWGPYIVPSVNELDKYKNSGLPITTVFPAQIYGADSWTVQLFIEPLYRKKPIYSLWGKEPMFSPIHVEDCARACLYLTKHASIGEKYILCDSHPITSESFKQMIEQELRVTGKTVKIPAWLCRLVIGPVLTEYATAHTYFSNDKLLDTGFKFRYPSAVEGIPQVTKQWLSSLSSK
ncbi:NAD-dependent epimerase/dehydratase family protein [Bacillus massiliigorillae]|uniref:NAD-dependent epimerase/dehydratase family protein n=1 Tax=Bacillus massiliigorillae TaxID=1243664 RepID=UPI0003A86C39|nr:NAD(P)-dependent oxidoreductase [Bacillus massiliigorillae]